MTNTITFAHELTISYIRQLIEADRQKSIDAQKFINELCGVEPIATPQQDAALDLISELYAGGRTTMMQLDDQQLEEYAEIFG